MARSSGLALLALFLLVAAAAADPGEDAQRPERFAELGPCTVEGLGDDALCGILEVPENRLTGEGRRLALHVAVVPATGDDRRDDPLFFLEGGPAAALSTNAASYLQAFAGIRRHRDLVLVDQRGTGHSHALHCPGEPAGAPSPRGGLISATAARACRADLEKKADLHWYTTAVAMDDLDDVRAWLGYSKINLFGISYGSRSALVYLRRHGEHVRSILVMAPYPLEHSVPLEAARIAQQALDRMIDDCAATPACAEAFPDLAGDLDRLDKRFEAAAVQAWSDQRIARSEFVAAVRMMLFFPQFASRVPLVISSASRGEFGPYVFVRNFLRSTLSQWISMGTFLTILCSEDVEGLDRDDVLRRARGSFIGPDWTLGLIEACAEWPAGYVPEDFGQPVRSEVPVLLMTGHLDPSMAPEWAIAAGGALPRSQTVVVGEGSHNFIGMSGIECLLGLMRDFVERGTAEGLDASCVDAMRRPPFTVPPSPPPPP